MDRTAGPSVGGGPLAVSVAARAATNWNGPHQSRVTTAHHLFSPPRRNLRTSRCFSSDNGSSTCWRMTTNCGVMPRIVPSARRSPGRHRVDLAVRTRTPWRPSALALEDAAHGEFVGDEPGEALRPRVGALDAPLLAGLAEQGDERVTTTVDGVSEVGGRGRGGRRRRRQRAPTPGPQSPRVLALAPAPTAWCSEPNTRARAANRTDAGVLILFSSPAQPSWPAPPSCSVPRPREAAAPRGRTWSRCTTPGCWPSASGRPSALMTSEPDVDDPREAAHAIEERPEVVIRRLRARAQSATPRESRASRSAAGGSHESSGSTASPASGCGAAGRPRLFLPAESA